MILKKSILFFITFTILLISCNNSNQKIYNSYSSLILKTTLSGSNRSIEPTHFNVDHYNLIFYGPNNESYTSVIEGTNVYISDDMDIGQWDVTLECLNVDNIKIAEKSVTFNIEDNKTTELEIIAELIEGEGK